MSSHLSASLFRLKLLDALRVGDEAKVDTLITELKAVPSTLENSELTKLRQTVIHLAVQVAPLPLIQHLISSEDLGIDVNSQNGDGNTPLHLTAASSRLNVVKYLMGLPNINDTVLNADRRQPVELAKDAQIAQLMQFERAKFVERSATNLRSYFSKRDFESLENLLVNNPRAAELLDINGADPETGNTVLHEFIAKEDLQMCEWILNHGGDPFKRDRRGKLPIDLVNHSSDPIKKLLKTVSKNQNILDSTSASTSSSALGNAPTYKGYLRKWTNFASGYKLRYFILDSMGVLSYYSNQGDTNNACRGSLNLGYATLHLDSSEKLKFEIIGKNGIKWHLKANHPLETNRWVWTLQNAITIAKDRIRKSHAKTAALRRSLDLSRPSKKEDTDDKKRRLLNIPSRRRLRKGSAGQVSVSSFAASDIDDAISINSDVGLVSGGKHSKSLLSKIQVDDQNSPRPSFDQAYLVSEDFDLDADGSDDSDTGSIGSPLDSGAVSKEGISSVKRTISIEVESILELFQALRYGTSDDAESNRESFEVGIKTLNNVKDLLEQYDALNQKRDSKLMKQIERQQEINKLWESSIRHLENEMQKQELALSQLEGKKYKLRKFLVSRGISSPQISVAQVNGLMHSSSSENVIQRKDPEIDDSSLLNEIFRDSDDEFFDADDFDDANSEADGPQNLEAVEGSTVEDVTPTQEQPGLPEISELTSGSLNDIQQSKLEMIEKEGSYLGYEKPKRTKLKMSEDDRPKVGLWGILKSMIGKDMTRMTLPVSFNECTSLLQRLVEDIEYNDLLSKAAAIDDSTLRMVYVAVFAASEYASTIDRIAKPFNPLLGETFEYCDNGNFRLISEQVSHHPPISACCAESPKWDYYGENAVESQFRGRSFDFKHLGKMFCAIRPDSGVINTNGEKVQEELYSWKKVNTSVVGIIVGNPTVDNYGSMEVRNHTTGDVIVVEMKQRGWKASSAYQLSGVVCDSKGQSHWAIGGHWNSKIFAKKYSGDVKMRRDSLIDASDVNTLDPYSGKKFLLWQAAARPKVPFNLTAFAITMNDINDDLRPWLAPTDTRLRPDQRAMEDGKYDMAADEKHRVEEKQRAARKKRELSREVYKPNWFIKSTHPVTGDRYWEFNHEYWVKRLSKELADTGDIF